MGTIEGTPHFNTLGNHLKVLTHGLEVTTVPLRAFLLRCALLTIHVYLLRDHKRDTVEKEERSKWKTIQVKIRV